jgi:hypothetical protein
MTFWEKIANISWWYYLVFIYIAIAGYTSTKPRTFYPRQLLLGYGIFQCLSLIGLVSLYSFSIHMLTLYLAGMLLGTCLGWLIFKIAKVTYAPETQSFQVKGSYFFLILLVGFALFKFYYESDLLNLIDSIGMNLILGILPGLFLGRLCFSFKFLKAR